MVGHVTQCECHVTFIHVAGPINDGDEDDKVAVGNSGRNTMRLASFLKRASQVSHVTSHTDHVTIT